MQTYRPSARYLAQRHRTKSSKRLQPKIESVNHGQFLTLVAYTIDEHPNEPEIDRITSRYRVQNWWLKKRIEYSEPIEFGGYTLLTFGKLRVDFLKFPTNKKHCKKH